MLDAVRCSAPAEALHGHEFTVEDRSPPSVDALDQPVVRRAAPAADHADETHFEYACHEGNYGIVNMLSGARAQERQVAGDEGASR